MKPIDSVGKTASLTIMSIMTHELHIFFHLFISSLISHSNVLQFPGYIFFTFLSDSFIFHFDIMLIILLFKISMSDCLMSIYSSTINVHMLILGLAALLNSLIHL